MSVDGATELVGSKEACAVLDIDKATISRWAASGILPVVQRLPGKHGAFLFRREDVERLAAERRAS